MDVMLQYSLVYCVLKIQHTYRDDESKEKAKRTVQALIKADSQVQIHALCTLTNQIRSTLSLTRTAHLPFASSYLLNLLDLYSV